MNMNIRKATPATEVVMSIKFLQQWTFHYTRQSLVLPNAPQIDSDTKGCELEILQIPGSIRCVANVCKRSHMNGNTEWNKSELINISHLLIFPTKPEWENFTVLHQYMGEIAGRVVCEGNRIYYSHASSACCSGGYKSADWSNCRANRIQSLISE